MINDRDIVLRIHLAIKPYLRLVTEGQWIATLIYFIFKKVKTIGNRYFMHIYLLDEMRKLDIDTAFGKYNTMRYAKV